MSVAFGKFIFDSRWYYSTTVVMVLLITAPACKSPRERQPVQGDKEQLIQNQRQIIRDESDEIDRYVARRGLNMETTSTGLRYMILARGNSSAYVSDDNVVRFKYSVSLLDGSVVYNSDSTGAMELQVGKSEIASGLQEGLKYLRQGDKARFIIPSHLAYGLTGDGDKIKQYQVLIVDVHLLEVIVPENN